MGNMNAESAMRSDNVEDRAHSTLGVTDAQYTAAVDNESYKNFGRDAYGYGLCQWTYWARKQNLLNYARSRGVSIGNESMQVDFCIQELKSEYPALWSYLCSCNGVYDAAARICKEYERPAVNNIDVRAQAANSFYTQFAGLKAADIVPPTTESHPTVEVKAESGVDDVAKKVSKESAYMLQALLVANGYDIKIDGIIGSKTKAAAKKFVNAI